jgi:ATP-dependent RNA helicase RhlE
MARGIDVPDISHVINYELPQEPEAYVHRIGRTARAGRGGIAISFCDGAERTLLKQIERLTRVQITEAKHELSAAALAAVPPASAQQARPPQGRPPQGRPPQRQGHGQGSGRSQDQGRSQGQGGRPQGQGRPQGEGFSGGPQRQAQGQSPRDQQARPQQQAARPQGIGMTRGSSEQRQGGRGRRG